MHISRTDSCIDNRKTQCLCFASKGIMLIFLYYRLQEVCQLNQQCMIHLSAHNLGQQRVSRVNNRSRWFQCSLCSRVVRVFSIASCDHRKPNDQASGEEREDARGNLKAPRVRQMIFVGIAAADPEVFALKSKRVVTEDHCCRHQEHTCRQTNTNPLKPRYNLQSRVVTELIIILNYNLSAPITKQQHS